TSASAGGRGAQVVTGWMRAAACNHRFQHAYDANPGGTLARPHQHRVRRNVMKRKSLCVVVGLAMFAVAYSASEQQGYSRLTFVGAVVQGACNSSVPPLGAPSG